MLSERVIKVRGYHGIWRIISERDGYMMAMCQGAYLIVDEQCNPIMADINNWRTFEEKYSKLKLSMNEVIENLISLKSKVLANAKGFTNNKSYKEALALNYAISLLKKENDSSPDTKYRCSKCENDKNFIEINQYETFIDQENNKSIDKFMGLNRVICARCENVIYDENKI